MKTGDFTKKEALEFCNLKEKATMEKLWELQVKKGFRLREDRFAERGGVLKGKKEFLYWGPYLYHRELNLHKQLYRNGMITKKC